MASGESSAPLLPTLNAVSIQIAAVCSCGQNMLLHVILGMPPITFTCRRCRTKYSVDEVAFKQNGPPKNGDARVSFAIQAPDVAPEIENIGDASPDQVRKILRPF